MYPTATRSVCDLYRLMILARTDNASSRTIETGTRRRAAKKTMYSACGHASHYRRQRRVQPACADHSASLRRGERHARAIAPSLVLVNFSMPYTISGVSDRYYYGTGLVVDAERGWVVVDRNTVPVALGDVRLTFAGSIEVPGAVEFVHPLHNLAVVSYDPQLLGETPVRSATFARTQFDSGDDVFVVGLSADHSLRSQSSEIDRVTQTTFPISNTLRFRDANLDVIELVNGPDDFRRRHR